MNLKALRRYLEGEKTRFIALMKKMVGFQTHSGDSASINRFAQFLEDLFREPGLTCSRTATAAGDIIQFDLDARSGEFLVLLGHMDTVKAGDDAQVARFIDPLLYGNGAYDMKNGIALIYYGHQQWKEDVKH